MSTSSMFVTRGKERLEMNEEKKGMDELDYVKLLDPFLPTSKHLLRTGSCGRGENDSTSYQQLFGLPARHLRVQIESTEDREGQKNERSSTVLNDLIRPLHPTFLFLS